MLNRVAALAALFSLAISPAEAAPFDGAALSLWWGAPFAGLLLSLAVLPAVAHRLWHDHFDKITAGWAIAFLIPFGAVFGLDVAFAQVVHALALEYVPFLLLVGSLYIVAGGLRVTGHLPGTPAVNTAILGVGAGLASLMGTTGAAMITLLPLVRANAHRARVDHIFVFHIFLVANIGGALTPIGDPPLFIGFLNGIDFFWTLRAMGPPMLVMAVPLLTGFYLLDRRRLAAEGPAAEPPGEGGRIGLAGRINLLFLAGIVGGILLSGFWKPGIGFDLFGTPVALQDLVRGCILVGCAAASLALTPKGLRKLNRFDWFPVKEVAILFLGIFLTIIPVLAIMQAGASGAAAGLVRLVGVGPAADPTAYFWMTGLLSSLLDNAPTYLVFFNLAGGDPAWLMGEGGRILLAVSMGAVFMGANSYVGNAPNFMVKSVVEAGGRRMPGFFGFIGWALVWLGPLYVIEMFLFLR